MPIFRKLPIGSLVNPDSHRHKRLPKVADAKLTQMEAIIRKRERCIIMSVDKTDDFRPQEEYHLSVIIVQLPKKVLKAFHLDCSELLAMLSTKGAVIFIWTSSTFVVPDSASYMTSIAERLKNAQRKDVL